MPVKSTTTTEGWGGGMEKKKKELVEDFIVEPMLAAKFPHLLYCVLGNILINTVGI